MDGIQLNQNIPQKTVPQPAVTTGLETSVSDKTPPTWTILGLTLGVLCGVWAGSFYSGNWLISNLLFFENKVQLEEDIIRPPGVGFNFDHNLKQIPEDVFTYADQITSLTIRSGSLKHIPEISTFVNLVRFEVSDNNLQSIAPEIEGLFGLETLNLGGNKLKNLPAEIGNLTNLKKLYLYDNKLTNLPEEIGFLTNLEILDLHLNSLTTLPSTIGNLINLKFLYLGGNKIPRDELENIPNLLPNTTIFF